MLQDRDSLPYAINFYRVLPDKLFTLHFSLRLLISFEKGITVLPLRAYCLKKMGFYLQLILHFYKFKIS